MCLAAFAINTSERFPFILIHNRDEFYNRRSTPLGPDIIGKGIFGGIDLKGGGAWLAVDALGRLAFVTNFRGPHSKLGSPLSRGSLVTGFMLGDESSDAYLKGIGPESEKFGPFNLILGTFEELHHFSSVRKVAQSIPNGIHGLSNGDLDEPWPKVNLAKTKLASALDTQGLQVPSLLQTLHEVLLDQTRPAPQLLPTTGVTPEIEGLLSSIFVRSPTYGTVSSTVLIVERNASSQERQVHHSEHTFNAEQEIGRRLLEYSV